MGRNKNCNLPGIEGGVEDERDEKEEDGEDPQGRDKLAHRNKRFLHSNHTEKLLLGGLIFQQDAWSKAVMWL